MRIELRGGVVLALAVGLTTSMGCGPAGCPTGYVESMGRCLDPDGGVDAGGRDADTDDDAGRPDASEVSDAGTDAGADVDADCMRTAFFRDVDGDGHGDAADSIAACIAPDGYVSSSDDCDDDCATCRPGGMEICNGRDDDCDGDTDAGLTTTWYVDCDGDGFAPSAEGAVDACTPPTTGPVSCTTGEWTNVYPSTGTGASNRRDCADTNRDAFPGQTRFFVTPISGVPAAVDFDYDCDGLERRTFTVAEEPCAMSGGRCDGGRWVSGAVPACGERASYVGCAMMGALCTSGAITSLQQSCR